MRIIALEPYYGGSHRAFLDGWIAHSRHDWTLLTLPARKWKWRMRHAAVTFAEQVGAAVAAGRGWDALLCCDMLNLAELVGLASESVRALPRVVYFHENQLTYPFRHMSVRDYHFGFINLTTALAADAVWFNSAYHRDSFLDALAAVLRRMPDFRLTNTVAAISAKASVRPPGFSPFPGRTAQRQSGPLRICWAARWEHDKNPELLFDALERLEARGVDFTISVIGERFERTPDVFERAEARFAGRIDHWGYQPTREAYVGVLRAADVFVSTAEHEFFGISAAEAVAAGAYPLLPWRLAYPELVARFARDAHEAGRFLYDGGADVLCERLVELANQLGAGPLWPIESQRAAAAMRLLSWSELAPAMDEAVDSLAARR